jgi:hypothetical protein
MTESSPRNQPFCIVTRFRFHNVGLKHEIVRVYYAAMNRLRLERVPPRQMPSEEIPIDLHRVVYQSSVLILTGMLGDRNRFYRFSIR